MSTQNNLVNGGLTATLQDAVLLSGLPNSDDTRKYFADMAKGELLAYVTSKRAAMQPTQESAPAAKTGKATNSTAVLKETIHSDSAMPKPVMPKPADKMTAHDWQTYAAAMEEFANGGQAATISAAISLRGAISLYGFGQFPITLYSAQWRKVGAIMPKLESFMSKHAERITAQGDWAKANSEQVKAISEAAKQASKRT